DPHDPGPGPHGIAGHSGLGHRVHAARQNISLFHKDLSRRPRSFFRRTGVLFFVKKECCGEGTLRLPLFYETNVTTIGKMLNHSGLPSTPSRIHRGLRPTESDEVA